MVLISPALSLTTPFSINQVSVLSIYVPSLFPSLYPHFYSFYFLKRCGSWDSEIQNDLPWIIQMWCGKLELTPSKSTSQINNAVLSTNWSHLSPFITGCVTSSCIQMQMQTSLFTPYASIYASLCQLLVALCLTSRLWVTWKQSSDLQVFHYCLLLNRIENRERGKWRESKGRKRGERKGGRERRKKRARWTLKILTGDKMPHHHSSKYGP